MARQQVESRKFSPEADRGFPRTFAFAEITEFDEEVGTFFPVPEGIEPGMHIVVDLPDGNEMVVKIPEGVLPGDVLQVKMQDAAMQIVRNMGASTGYFKPLRVLMFAIGVCPVVLLLLAMITPHWVHLPGSNSVDCVGLGGRRLNGYIEDWNAIDAWCAAEEGKTILLGMPVSAQRCAVYKRLAPAGKFTLICLAVSVVVHMWSMLGLFFRREFSTVVGVLSALVIEMAVIIFYLSVACLATKETFRHPAVLGRSAWIGIAAVAFGFAVWFGILLAYLDSQLDRNFIGAHLRAVQERLRKGYGADVSYEWDETDPGAGCPVVWRTYGLTPSGLYHAYRNHWWGWPYATALYLLSVPVHFIKTFDWNGIRRVWYGPPSEEQPLRERGVTSTVVINYMLYRRSNIIMCVVFVVPLLYMTLNALSGQEADMLTHMQEAEQPHSFEIFKRQQAALNLSATFPDYSLHVLRQGLGSVGIWSDSLWIARHLVRLLCLVFAFVFSLTAMLRWDDFKLSRYLLVFAWLAILMCPFVAALIPSRAFVDWGLFDKVVTDLSQEARLHYQIDGILASCLWVEPSTIVDNFNYYAEAICDVVNDKVPYVMPDGIPISTPMGTFSVAPSSLPWVGAYLPYPGTDLKVLHSICLKVRKYGSLELTNDTAAAIARGCQLAGTYLYENTPVGQQNDFRDYKEALAQSVKVDPSHLKGNHVLRFHTNATIQEVVGLYLKSESKELSELSGRLIRPTTTSNNPDGCHAYEDEASTCEDQIIFLGPVTSRLKCSLANMVSHASNAGAKGLVIYGAPELYDSSKSAATIPLWLKNYHGSFPIGFISSRVDGDILLRELEGGRNGLAVTVEVARREWKKDHGRTSRGCRCKGRGFDSECKVRDPGLFTQERKTGQAEPFPWCETAEPCPVAYDVCVPPGAASAVRIPSKACLPNFPCRRKHVGIHELKQKRYTWKPYGRPEKCAISYQSAGKYGKDTIEWMDCVAPLGLSGVVTTAEGQDVPLEGTKVSFASGMSAVRLRGMLIISAGCFFRLRVESADNAFVQMIISGTTAENGEILSTTGEDEVDLEIDIRSGAGAETGVGAVVLEQQCESAGENWAPVPLERLRYIPSPSSLQSSLLQGGQREVFRHNGSQAGFGAYSSDSSRSESISTHTLGSELGSSQGSRWMEASADSATASRSWNMSWTCESFVGTPCHNLARCGENEVCDSVGLGEHWQKPGRCRCSPGYCWSVPDHGCVPQKVHARDVVSYLLDESVVGEKVTKVLDTGKMAMSLVTSLQEGISNLNAIIGHVLAIGPGMLISAWTAKLIFAHSAIPAYFCYFFPWIYSPMAWALYNVYYQLLPDWRLFTGLLILAGWPIIMTGLTMMNALHRQVEVPRLMSVVNNLLLYYYFILFVGYGLLIWFALGYRPEGNDWINERLRGEWSVANWIQYYIGMKQADKHVNFINLWLVDSFATFFFTCNAVTDAFIVMISQEHNEAWLMHHKARTMIQGKQDDSSASLPASSPAMTKVPTLQDTMEEYARMQGRRFEVEEEVIKDWLLLINDVKVEVPEGRRERPAEQDNESEASDPSPGVDGPNVP